MKLWKQILFPLVLLALAMIDAMMYDLKVPYRWRVRLCGIVARDPR